MPLTVRRLKVADLPVLEALELETVKRFPARAHWPETFSALLEKALSEEPEGLLVADYDGRAIGVAIARLAGPHPLTGELSGRVHALSVAPGWKSQGIAERLLKESEAYLRARGCAVLSVALPADAGADAEVFKASGFTVAGWELERRVTKR